MCQVDTGTYVSLLAPENTGYTACRPEKTPTNILHVVSITTHAHVRIKSIGKRKEKKKKEKKRKEKKRKDKKKKRRRSQERKRK